MKKRPLRIVKDTREQDGFSFQSLLQEGDEIVDGTLTTGDYSLAGYQNRVCVERKNPNDLVKSLTDDRARFEAEMVRMVFMDAAMVVVEAPKDFFLLQRHHGKTSGKSIIQSCFAFEQRYRVSFALCEDKEDAERRTYAFLRHYARDRHLGRPTFADRLLIRAWDEIEGAAT
jgi:DNA excision repair protein ERCC-4